MKIIADFHLHSKYSRAVSSKMDLENLDKWAKIKGINIIATGDFTHPKWFKEIKEKLEPAEPGLFLLKKEFKLDSLGRLNNNLEPRFILTTEISSIYSKNGKVRRIHNLVFLPSIEAVEKFNNRLSFLGNLSADGRPILGLDSKELLKLSLEIDPETLLIPAHAWTPWFSIFGSKSGFDSIEECFEELTPQIFAIESGLSSDPKMNWRLSSLDKVAIISNSDSHSLTRIGREANVFNLTELSYFKIREAIKEKNPEKFLFTIEFFPEEGKYHYDGHRLCKVSFSPEESKKYNLICPKCKKFLTIGVASRVEELADRPDGFKLENAIPYKNLVPLDQIISDSLGVREMTKSVWQEYEKLISKFGNEFNVLLEANKDDLEKTTLPQIVEGIIRVKEGKLKIEPGYDGEYGKIKIFSNEERENITKQKTLF